MRVSITRKFLASSLPELSHLHKIHSERYYLYLGEKSVIRIQTKNDLYELERKEDIAGITRESNTIPITSDEFDALKQNAHYIIIRDSYQIAEKPYTMLRVYDKPFQGLYRVEVNFETEEAASAFTPLSWYTREITHTALAQDNTLLRLSPDEFMALLHQ